MALFIDERCIASLLTMDDALDAVEEVFREQGRGGVTNVPRVRAPLKGGVLRITAGVLSYRGLYGVKVSSTAVFGRNAGRMFSLYREESGELCAIVQVFGMGALRTGAASGVATKFMANEGAATLGVEPDPTTPAAFDKLIVEQVALMGKLARAAGIKPQ